MVKSLDIIDPKKELQEEEEEEKEPRSEGDDFRMPRDQKEGGGGVFYLVLGIIAIVVATGAALYILYKDYLPNKNDPNNKTASVTVLTSASASPTISASTTLTTSATQTAFKYTDQKIRIVNGNGVSGEATKVRELLESKGFTVDSVGNASRSYSETIVYYKQGQEALANALKSEISSLYSASVEMSNSVVGGYDAVIALGSK